MTLNPAIPVTAIDTELLLRLGVAALIGLLLGIDRELRRYPAGLRTHGLVCFSAALTTVSVISLYNEIGGPGSRMDPLRMVEGIAAFMGIVAAALIVVRGGDVHNLTTAVHLWLASAIGVASGAGQWPLVAIGTGMALVMMTLLRVLEKRWLEPLAEENGGTDGRERSPRTL